MGHIEFVFGVKIDDLRMTATKTAIYIKMVKQVSDKTRG